MTLKLIIADDSPSIRQMLAFSLNQENIDITEAADGAEALEKMGKSKFNMLITDLDMPKMDGIELIRRARTLNGCRTIPILILTTESDRGKKEEAKKAGANGWVIKPFTPSQIRKVVKKMLA